LFSVTTIERETSRSKEGVQSHQKVNYWKAVINLKTCVAYADIALASQRF